MGLQYNNGNDSPSDRIYDIEPTKNKPIRVKTRSGGGWQGFKRVFRYNPDMAKAYPDEPAKCFFFEHHPSLLPTRSYIDQLANLYCMYFLSEIRRPGEVFSAEIENKFRGLTNDSPSDHITTQILEYMLRRLCLVTRSLKKRVYERLEYALVQLCFLLLDNPPEPLWGGDLRVLWHDLILEHTGVTPHALGQKFKDENWLREQEWKGWIDLIVKGDYKSLSVYVNSTLN